MKLDIQPGYYDSSSQAWTLDRTHVYMMRTETGELATATPVIYGHDIPAVFMGLSGMAPDEIIIITQDDGRQLYFQYLGDKIVAPTDTEWLHQTTPDTVYLMTCTGSRFENRRIMQLHFVGASAPAGQPTEER